MGKGKGERGKGLAMPPVLTQQQVIEVRESYLTGEFSMKELASNFGLTKSAVRSILDCRNWPHLLAKGEAEALAQVRAQRRNGN